MKDWRVCLNIHKLNYQKHEYKPLWMCVGLFLQVINGVAGFFIRLSASSNLKSKDQNQTAGLLLLCHTQLHNGGFSG